MRLTLLSLVLVLFLLHSPTARASEIRGKSIFDAVNTERQSHGLQPLAPSKALVAAAQAKADHMVTSHYFAHVRGGVGIRFFLKKQNYSYVVAGENLAEGYVTTEEVMSAWLGSLTHKANILDPSYKETGIGLAEGNGTLLIVQYFGTRK